MFNANVATPQQAMGDMQRFLGDQRLATKYFYGPFFSRYSLGSLANATTGTVNPGTIDFFSVGVGGTGQGYTRALTYADTNMETSGGSMAGGVSWVVDKFGIYVDARMPRTLKAQIAETTFINQERQSHLWRMGRTAFWPAGGFGVQAQSTTANATDYGVNGTVKILEFPLGSYLYFPANQQIKIQMNLTTTLFATNTGEVVASADDVLDPEIAAITVVMYGWRFEGNAVG